MLPVPTGMSYLDVVASATFFQFSLYVCARLAHRGFTFGELGLVAFGATVLFMELLNLTSAKVRIRFIPLHSPAAHLQAIFSHIYGSSSGRSRLRTSGRSGSPLHCSSTSSP